MAEPRENNQKLCPFSQTACMMDECAMWVNMHVMKASSLGVGTIEPVSMCAFQALVLAAALPKSGPAPANLAKILGG